MLRVRVAIAMFLALSIASARAHAVVPLPPGGAAPTADPAPPVESPDVEAAHDRALSALAAGLPEQAVADLETVATKSIDARRRADAAALAGRIRNRHLAAPSSPTPVTPSSTAATAPTAPPSGRDGSPAPGATAAVPAAAAEEPDQAGRTVFLATTTLLGLTAYGWTLPTALNIDSTRAFLAFYMLTAGTSFVAPYLATRNRELTWGTTNAAWYGGTRGLLHGVMVGGVISPHDSKRGTAAALLTGSVLELTAASIWSSQTDPTPAAMRTMAWAGDFGLLFGLGIAHLTGLDLHDRTGNINDNDNGVRLMLSCGLLGNVGGLIAGSVLADRDARRLTWGDGEVTRAAGLLGAFAAAAVADWFDAFGKDYSRAYVGAMMTGAAAGLYFGHRLGLKNDFSVGRAILVDLGTLAGGLLGAGITYLATPDGTDDATPFITAAAGGAIVGFALTTYSLGVPGSLDATASTRSTGFTPQLVPLLGRSGQRGVALAGMF